MTPHLSIRFVDTAELILGRINLAHTVNGLELRLHPDTRVDPAVIDPLEREGNQALSDLVSMMVPGVVPTIRYHIERNVPGLVHVELSPYQTDVHLERGLVPVDVADEIAGHSTNLMRHYTV